MLKYKIPLIPPSNNEYQGNGGMKKNMEYQREKRQWAGYVQMFCNPKPRQPLKRARITLQYFFPDRRRRDPDNYSGKFILDGLVKAGIIADDNFFVIDLFLKADIDTNKQGFTVIEVTEL